MKKIVSMILSFVLIVGTFTSLGVLSVFAEENTVYAKINGFDITHSGYFYEDGSEATEDDYKIAYDVDSKTLTLNNAKITKPCSCSRGGFPYVTGIYLRSKSTLTLIGDNNIALEVVGDSINNQIARVGISCAWSSTFSWGSFIINGDGNLDIRSDDWLVSSWDYIFADFAYYGIKGNVTKEGSGTVSFSRFNMTSDAPFADCKAVSECICGDLALIEGKLNVYMPNINLKYKGSVATCGISSNTLVVKDGCKLYVQAGVVDVDTGEIEVRCLYPKDVDISGAVRVDSGFIHSNFAESVLAYGFDTKAFHCANFRGASLSSMSCKVEVGNAGTAKITNIGYSGDFTVWGDSQLDFASGGVNVELNEDIVSRAFKGNVYTKPDKGYAYRIVGKTVSKDIVLSPTKFKNLVEVSVAYEKRNLTIVPDEEAFPDGASIDIHYVDMTEDSFDTVETALGTIKFEAYDVTALSDNMAVQPRGKVKLTFNVPDNYDISKVKLYYISNDREAKTLDCTVDKSARQISAYVSHFSTYALTDSAVATTVYGDANGDGTINMLDVLLIRKYIAKQPITLNFDASDVTHDGNVNMLDILKIRKYIAKQPVDLSK